MARLSNADDGYGLTAEQAGAITGGDLRLASDQLDALGPFEGERAQRDQEREFPRVVHVGDSRNGARVPDAVLDWVALRASISSDEEGEEAISSESVLDRSVSYARPKRSRAERLLPDLSPYLLHVGSRA